MSWETKEPRETPPPVFNPRTASTSELRAFIGNFEQEYKDYVDTA